MVVVVLLVGGKGLRLRPLTENTPKSMVLVRGKPLLQWKIEGLASLGVKKIVLLTGRLANKIEDYFGDGKKFGVNIYYSREEVPLGTGGAIKNAEEIILNALDESNGKYFVVGNGDILMAGVGLGELISPLRKNPKLVGSILAIPPRLPYGLLEIDENNYITAFKEKPILEGQWINAGYYGFTPEIFNYLPEEGDIERTALPELARRRKLIAIKKNPKLWLAIDTVKDYKIANQIPFDKQHLVII